MFIYPLVKIQKKEWIYGILGENQGIERRS